MGSTEERPTVSSADDRGEVSEAELARLRAIEDAARAVDAEWYSLDFEARLAALREALR